MKKVYVLTAVKCINASGAEGFGGFAQWKDAKY